MRETGNAAAARPYHHGDLSRALVDAARRILEREGPQALSLRAVAREAGVSPAAPYHHFKDKGELLEAIAHEGWEALGVSMREHLDGSTPGQRRTALGVAYVKFARDNPALYRVMGDCSRESGAAKGMEDKADTAYDFVRRTIAENNAPGMSEQDLELATIASWCAAHGLSEIVSFRQFDELKQKLGGEEAFVRAVLEHLGSFSRSHH